MQKVLKTIAVILIVFLIGSCASKQPLKEQTDVTLSQPPAEEETKETEPPAQKPPEIKKLKKKRLYGLSRKQKTSLSS